MRIKIAICCIKVLDRQAIGQQRAKGLVPYSFLDTPKTPGQDGQRKRYLSLAEKIPLPKQDNLSGLASTGVFSPWLKDEIAWSGLYFLK